MTEYQFVLYEPIDDGRIVRIMLNRPSRATPRTRGLLVELNDASSGPKPTTRCAS